MVIAAIWKMRLFKMSYPRPATRKILPKKRFDLVKISATNSQI